MKHKPPHPFNIVVLLAIIVACIASTLYFANLKANGIDRGNEDFTTESTSMLSSTPTEVPASTPSATGKLTPTVLPTFTLKPPNTLVPTDKPTQTSTVVPTSTATFTSIPTETPTQTVTPTSTPIPPPPTSTPTPQPPSLILNNVEQLPGNVFVVTWSWNGSLDPDMYYAVRFWPVDYPEQRHSLVWIKETRYDFNVNNEQFPAGSYLLNIAVVRDLNPGDGSGHDGLWEAMVESEPKSVDIPIIVPTPKPPTPPDLN